MVDNLNNGGRSFHSALETGYVNTIDEVGSDLENELGDIEPIIEVLATALTAVLGDTVHLEYTPQPGLDCWNFLHVGEDYSERRGWKLEWRG